jgi:TM2 domain-containing membrane protein YozV
MQCPYCGNSVVPGVSRCPSCGAAIQDNVQPSYAPSASFSQAPNGQQRAGQGPAKTRVVYLLLGIFLGSFGVHNFYAGYTGKAVIQLLITLVTCGWGGFISWIWAIIEVCTVQQDAKGVPFV